jgi:hypothetical protein
MEVDSNMHPLARMYDVGPIKDPMDANGVAITPLPLAELPPNTS